MNTSIEITLMPLNDDYKSIIKKFIISLREMHFQILENPLTLKYLVNLNLLCCAHREN